MRTSLYKAGDSVDGYIVTGLLGFGGMGVIYRVHHPILGKDFALKILPADLVDPARWRRFQSEGRALARINHPNIVAIHNMGVEGRNCPYFVMDWLPGVTLADRCGGQALPLDEVVGTFLQIASGLHSAHQCGVVHRDVKPSNIMLTPTAGGNFQVKIVDFGIARLSSNGSLNQLTASGEIIGSPLYMSPEQCLGGAIDQRTDIYSLGCTLFEALAGCPPFQGETALQTAMMHQMQPVPRLAQVRPDLSYPPALEAILSRMLAKSASDRFDNLHEFALHLANLDERKTGESWRIGAISTSGLSAVASCEQSLPQSRFIPQSESQSQTQSHQYADSYSDRADATVPVPVRSALMVLGILSISLLIAGLLAWFVLALCASVQSTSGASKKSAEAWKIAGPISNTGCSVLVSEQIPVRFLKNIKPLLIGYGPGPKGKRMMYLRNPGLQSGLTLECGHGTMLSNNPLVIPETAPVMLRVGYTVGDYPAVIDKAGPDIITQLRLDGIDSNPADFLARVTKWHRLEQVTLSRYELKEGYLKGLLMPRSYDLILRGDIFSGAHLSEIPGSAIRNLRSLSFYGEKVPCDFLIGLERASSLEVVNFGDAVLESGVIAKLAVLKKLNELNLEISPPAKKAAGDPYAQAQPEFKPGIINELKQLHQLKRMRMTEPHWTRLEITRLLRDVPAVRANLWAAKYRI